MTYMKRMKVILALCITTGISASFFSDLKNTDWTQTGKTYYEEGKRLYDQYGNQVTDVAKKASTLYQQNQATVTPVIGQKAAGLLDKATKPLATSSITATKPAKVPAPINIPAMPTNIFAK